MSENSRELILNMGSIKCESEIALPRFNADQNIVRRRIESGVLLKDEHYLTLIEDAKSTSHNELNDILDYLRFKYGVNFNRGKISKILKEHADL